MQKLQFYVHLSELVWSISSNETVFAVGEQNEVNIFTECTSPLLWLEYPNELNNVLEFDDPSFRFGFQKLSRYKYCHMVSLWCLIGTCKTLPPSVLT